MAQTKKRTQYDIMHPLFTAIEHSDLSSSEAMLLLGLYRHMDGEGVCYPGYKKLMATTKLSDRTISANIKKLCEKGWITYRQGNKSKNQANEYHLNLVRLGIETQQGQRKVVSIDRRFLAEDGNYYDSPAEYFRVKHNI